MKWLGCEHEEATRKAAFSGQWESTIRDHASTCQVCREVVQISECLRSLAEQSPDGPVPPDFHQIWWRAQLLAKQTVAERVTRPIRIFEAVGGTASALALTGWCAWNWPEIDGWVSALPRFTWLSPSLLWLSVALFCVAAVFVFQVIFAEE